MGIIQTALLVSLALTQLSGGLSAADREIVVQGNSAFALEFYDNLKESEGNLFFSPFSISTALAMTYAGARGNTSEQMAEVLHFDLGQKKLHPAYRELLDELNVGQESEGYQLSVADALWGQKGYRFLGKFLELTKDNYGAGLKEVDYTGATEEARVTINAWVEKETENKIKELIKPGVLDRWTRLVLTNAIYFKGFWESQFEEGMTLPAPFALVSGERVEVPTMHKTADFKYMEGENFQALELSYVGESLAMTIFLPKEADGIRAFESSLTADRLLGYLSDLREREVIIALPKFEITSEFSLAEVLKSMGMTDVFDENKADLSGMTGKRDLYITAVLHKAFVEVNEEGTEAAAATGVVVGLTSAPPSQTIFRADHPFVFLIRDLRSGSILFMGRVLDPRD